MEPYQIVGYCVVMSLLFVCIILWPRLWGIRGVSRVPCYIAGCHDPAKCSLSTVEIEEIINKRFPYGVN